MATPKKSAGMGKIVRDGTNVSYPLGKNYPGKTKGMSGSGGRGVPAHKRD